MRQAIAKTADKQGFVMGRIGDGTGEKNYGRESNFVFYLTDKEIFP